MEESAEARAVSCPAGHRTEAVARVACARGNVSTLGACFPSAGPPADGAEGERHEKRAEAPTPREMLRALYRSDSRVPPEDAIPDRLLDDGWCAQCDSGSALYESCIKYFVNKKSRQADTDGGGDSNDDDAADRTGRTRDGDDDGEDGPGTAGDGCQPPAKRRRLLDAPSSEPGSRVLLAFARKTDPSRTVGGLKPTHKHAVRFALGLGTHRFSVRGGRQVFAVHRGAFPPLAAAGGAIHHPRTLMLFAETRELLRDVLDRAIESRVRPAVVHLYAFVKTSDTNGTWRRSGETPCRPPDSVVLPPGIRDDLLADAKDFGCSDTAEWYTRHGILYKRVYLFHGLPGTGKSSLISAMAAHTDRSIYSLYPSALTDQLLHKAVREVPPRSVVALEDVDSLFGMDRRRNPDESASYVTFSGLLNALDGAGCNAAGHIFVMTTNHVERLDPALIRAGRVDVRVAFPSATAGQARSMFLLFYPNEHDAARDFVAELVDRFTPSGSGTSGKNSTTRVRKGRSGRTRGKAVEEEERTGGKAVEDEEVDAGSLAITMATLQKHFIACRRATAREAVARLKSFIPANDEIVREPIHAALFT